MGVTTIKVSTQLRDRLREEADREDATLGELLEALLAERERARRFADLRSAMAASPAPDRSSWLAETQAWEAVATDGPDA